MGAVEKHINDQLYLNFRESSQDTLHVASEAV